MPGHRSRRVPCRPGRGSGLPAGWDRGDVGVFPHSVGSVAVASSRSEVAVGSRCSGRVVLPWRGWPAMAMAGYYAFAWRTGLRRGGDRARRACRCPRVPRGLAVEGRCGLAPDRAHTAGGRCRLGLPLDGRYPRWSGGRRRRHRRARWPAVGTTHSHHLDDPQWSPAAVWTSPDGRDWTRRVDADETFSGDGHTSVTSITVGPHGLVAIGEVGAGDGSTTGAVWTSR